MEMNGYTLDSLSSYVDLALSRVAGRQDQAELEELHAQVLASSEQDHVADDRWDQAEGLFEDGTSVKGIVTGWNRGGLLVRWNGLQGFVPVSQLREIPVFQSEAARDEQLARWVGEELRLRVIELDRGRNRLVFSERATLWDPDEGDRTLE